jgi:hypothetical protein
MIDFLVALFALLNTKTPPPSSATGPQIWHISFCQPDIRTVLKRGYAFFFVAYTFTLDQNGIPRNIQKVKGPGIDYAIEDHATVESCFEQWRIPIPGAEVEVQMYWKHGFGWEWMEIRSRQFKQRITMGGQPCKYP